MAISGLAPALQALPPSPYAARVWQVDDGLPDNRVTGLAQTADGYLWTATRGGLARFNGATFEVFPLSALNGVIGSGTTGVHADSQGFLWLGAHRDTLLRVGRDSAKVITAADGVPTGSVIGFAEDRDRRVWLTFPGNVCWWDGQRLQSLKVTDGAGIGGRPSVTADAEGRLWCTFRGRIGVVVGGRFEQRLQLAARDLVITQARGGGIWACTDAQVVRIDARGAVVREIPYPASASPHCAVESRDGSLWIGTESQGLLHFDGTAIERIETSHRHISALLEDREGNLWAGTFGGGVDRVRLRAVNLAGAPGGLPFESVISVTQDASGTIWAVGRNGEIARGDGNAWELVPHATPFPEGGATCIAADRQGTLWIGTGGHGVHEINLPAGRSRIWQREDGLPSNSVRSILVTADGSVLVATNSPANLSRFGHGQFKPCRLPAGVRNIRALAEGAAGEIWAGTSDGKVLRLSGEALVEEPAIAQAGSESVRSLHGEPDGSLWIGYAGAGVGYFKAGRLARLTPAHGLLENSVAQIATDRAGSLWLAGARGLYRVSRDEAVAVATGRQGSLRATLFGRAEGLPNLQPHYDNTPSVCNTRDGRIWFATSLGLLVLDPTRIRDNPTPPPVVLERVTADDRVAALRGSRFPLRGAFPGEVAELGLADARLRLAPDHRRLTFSFAALSFSAPENVRFRYRLENFDDDWVEATPDRSAQYPRLSAGDYTFRVIACNDAGAWNDRGDTLAIRVDPFAWQTWWFRAAMLGLFTGAVAGIVRFVSLRRLQRQLRRAEQQAALSQERSRIARDIHDDLGGSLAHIKLLSEIAVQDRSSPDVVAEHLHQITRATQDVLKSLDETIWAINPRNDTLPHLISYLGQYAVDHLRAAGISCPVDLPDNPPDLPFPSDRRHHVFLATKEALTNVVRHSGARTAQLQVKVADGRLRLVVDDDGRGFDPPPDDALADGIRNMRQRLDALGGSFSIRSTAGKGTRIEFEVPLAGGR